MDERISLNLIEEKNAFFVPSRYFDDLIQNYGKNRIWG